MTKRIDTRATDDAVLASLWSLLPRGNVATASVREIERKTLISRGSIGRSLKRLAEEGRIKKLPQTQRSYNAAHRYQLVDDENGPSPLWSRQGLGVTTRTIYQVLCSNGGMTAKEVASKASCSGSTASKALQKLLSSGLIDCDRENRYHLLDDPSYFKWYEEWLCGKTLKETSRKIDREQAEWNAIASPKERGPLPER